MLISHQHLEYCFLSGDFGFRFSNVARTSPKAFRSLPLFFNHSVVSAPAQLPQGVGSIGTLIVYSSNIRPTVSSSSSVDSGLGRNSPRPSV